MCVCATAAPNKLCHTLIEGVEDQLFGMGPPVWAVVCESPMGLLLLHIYPSKFGLEEEETEDCSYFCIFDYR